MMEREENNELPKDRRTVEELEKQVRRLVARALKGFAADRKEFGR
jgi:hypothetical protein